MKYGLGLLVLCLNLASCTEDRSFVRQENWNGKLITVFDITEKPDVRDTLKLSELVKDLKVVPLETSGQSLVGGDADYFIGDSCILVFQENQISMFDRQGRFVRVIARQGRAPREYYGISDYAVDEKNNMLYLVGKYEDGGIKSYHLKDSLYFRKIETLEQTEHAGIACLENGNFLLVPYPYDKVKYTFYQQTPEGELGEYACCHSSRKGIHYKSYKLMYVVGNSYLYRSEGQMFSDDTIFEIRGKELVPVWLFKATALRHYRVNAETADRLFFTTNFVQKHDKVKTKSGTSERVMSMSYSYVYSKNTGQLAAIHSLLKDDLWAHTTWHSFKCHFQDGHKLYIVCPVADLLELAEKRKEQASLSSPEWNELVSHLTEEDNPVLLIGDLK